MLPERDNESVEVVLKILFPETLIRLYQKITRKSYKEAEKELFQGKVRCEIIKDISYFFWIKIITNIFYSLLKKKTHRELCLEIGFPYPEEWDDPQSDKQFVEEVFISELYNVVLNL